MGGLLASVIGRCFAEAQVVDVPRMRAEAAGGRVAFAFAFAFPAGDPRARAFVSSTQGTRVKRAKLCDSNG